MSTKVYLGDSVYAEYHHTSGIVLTTENMSGYPPSNTIFLEPETIRELLKFIIQVRPVDGSNTREDDLS